MIQNSLMMSTRLILKCPYFDLLGALYSHSHVKRLAIFGVSSQTWPGILGPWSQLLRVNQVIGQVDFQDEGLPIQPN